MSVKRPNSTQEFEPSVKRKSKPREVKNVSKEKWDEFAFLNVHVKSLFDYIREGEIKLGWRKAEDEDVELKDANTHRGVEKNLELFQDRAEKLKQWVQQNIEGFSNYPCGATPVRMAHESKFRKVWVQVHTLRSKLFRAKCWIMRVSADRKTPEGKYTVPLRAEKNYESLNLSRD